MNILGEEEMFGNSDRNEIMGKICDEQDLQNIIYLIEIGVKMKSITYIFDIRYLHDDD